VDVNPSIALGSPTSSDRLATAKMSTVPTTQTFQDGATPSSHHPKPPRVLACVLCQQRKVKCDRKFPCANCIKSRSQCVPSTLAQRQRRRRFPERALLERLRKYEDLLQQNNIVFEPLHKAGTRHEDPLHAESDHGSDDGQPGNAGVDSSSPSTTIKSERVHEAKYALSTERYRDD